MDLIFFLSKLVFDDRHLAGISGMVDAFTKPKCKTDVQLRLPTVDDRRTVLEESGDSWKHHYGSFARLIVFCHFLRIHPSIHQIYPSLLCR